jgi:hypothetical protein
VKFHIHIGLAEFAVFLCYYILASGLLRALAIRWHENIWGKALAVIN